MTTPHKTCTKCGETKPLDEFHKDARKRDGRRSYCKHCVAERDRRYSEKNREKINEWQRRHYEENRKGILARQRQYREEHREEILAQQRRRGEGRQGLTAVLATVPPGTRWLPGEEALLMADNGMTVYQKAIELGRTYSSCMGHRKYLRKKANQ